MNKRHFHQLLTRYRSGECTEREARLVDQWFALIDVDAEDLAGATSELTEARLWNAIRSRSGLDTKIVLKTTEMPMAESKPLHFFIKWRWAAAVVLMLAAFGGYQWVSRQNGRPGKLAAGETLANLVAKTNSTAAPMWVLLPDGSRVSLQPQSTIEYPTDFQSDKREIYLKGKAFFEVARDERKPFLVYTGEVTTKVLGTSFWVNRTEADKAVEVSVVTGKVSVFQKDKEKEARAGNLTGGVVLGRNQRVKYTPDTKQFTAVLVKTPIADEVYKNAFVFDDARLSTVAQTLEQAYGIDIVLANERLKNCLFTADINSQPLFTQLALIAASVNATYSIKGTKIFLDGKGCR
ncbi:anti-sigma factor [Dyadobacter beijingensis]|uniref:Anti-sigma factor n=1 Tax=Dyadobacter beijingensis TaxID=365489 RepID=A0ABQ2I2A2_9BACT|nr:FecR family protein [Dyadobacter beijingensis]GGM96346.1 anti-sigma factor [Dyadobacter beijingensis]